LETIGHLEQNGCFGRIVSIDHLHKLRSDVEPLHQKKIIDESLYQNYLSGFKYNSPTILRDANSIVVVAVPQPIIRASFQWKGKSISMVIPPTYADGLKVIRNVRKLLQKSVQPNSFKFVKARLPLKSLAVHSGLALYGRNNITYIPKYGSFHRLVAFVTDYQDKIDLWQPHQALSKCKNCQLCLKACPTGAISEDRFLLRSERCLTYLNEKTAEHAFPEWLDPSCHNAIVGCMRCQRVCPYNKDVINWSECRGEFTEDETAYLLKGNFSGKKAAQIERKLKKVGLDLTYFPRNLSVLLQR